MLYQYLAAHLSQPPPPHLPGKIQFSFFIPILLHFIACSFLFLLLLLLLLLLLTLINIQQARFCFLLCCYACLLPFGSNIDPLFFVILLVLLFQVKAVFVAPWFCNVTRKEVANILTLTHISAQQQKFVTFKLYGYLRFNIFTPKVSIFFATSKEKN